MIVFGLVAIVVAVITIWKKTRCQLAEWNFMSYSCCFAGPGAPVGCIWEPTRWLLWRTGP